MSVPKRASVDIPINDMDGRYTHICASLFVNDTCYDRVWCLSVYPIKIEKEDGYITRTVSAYSGCKKDVMPVGKRLTLKSFKTACEIAQTDYPLMIRHICLSYGIPAPNLSEYPDLKLYADF